MASSAIVDDEATIIGRAIRPDDGDWPADVANAMLRITVAPKDVTRMNELAELARRGELSSDEEMEIENYRRAGRLVEMFKAKARLSLVRAGKLT